MATLILAYFSLNRGGKSGHQSPFREGKWQSRQRPGISKRVKSPRSCFLLESFAKPRESATENKPPAQGACASERVRMKK